MGQVANLRPIGNRHGGWGENRPRRQPLYRVRTFHIRRLPHLHAVGQPIFLTWFLAGSLPASRRFPEMLTSGQAFVAMDRILDRAESGPRYLERAEIAALVVEAMEYRAVAGEYDLHSWVIMSNHVHLLITPHVPVPKVMQSLKRFTARQANLILGFTGLRFWQDECYDRLVRDGTEFERIKRYIEWNPVRAGLVASPEEFFWSSARPIANRPQVANLPHNSPDHA